VVGHLESHRQLAGDQLVKLRTSPSNGGRISLYTFEKRFQVRETEKTNHTQNCASGNKQTKTKQRHLSESIVPARIEHLAPRRIVAAPRSREEQRIHLLSTIAEGYVLFLIESDVTAHAYDN